MGNGRSNGDKHPLTRARELVAILDSAALPRVLAAGDFAHLEGDDAETTSVVLAGQLLLESHPPSAWEPAPIEEALAGRGGVRTSTVRALTTARVMVVYCDDLLRTIAAHENARRLLFAMVADRVHLSNGSALANSAISVDVRVVRWLLHMHAVFAEGADSRPDIAATQEQLAGLAGTRRPTANKTLQALQREGLITIGRGRLQVSDPAGLERWLEDRAADTL
jgi:CRP-like cAMP-binding protein